VTALIEDKPGRLAALTEAIAAKKGNFIAFGQFTDANLSNKIVTFKVKGLTLEEVKETVGPVVKEIRDIRS
jgi:acetoin utilization protein AcuB